MNLQILTQQFKDGTVRATWLPSKLNLADTLTRAVVNPIQVVNSPWYRSGVTPNGEEFVDFVEKLKRRILAWRLKGVGPNIMLRM